MDEFDYIIKQLEKLIDSIEYGDITRNRQVEKINEVIIEIQELRQQYDPV